MTIRGEAVFPWLVAVLIPPLVVLTVVRVMLWPAYLHLVYHLPGFPPDTLGFTPAERLHWAEITRQYLLNDADIGFLANRTLPDGRPLFNERELRHMADVKRVTRGALAVDNVVTLAVAVLAYLASRLHWRHLFRRGVGIGGLLTVGLTLAVLVLSLLAFDTLFVDFHRVFFEGDTWLFAYNDTLIRLFPEFFWRVAFVSLGGLSLLMGGALAAWGR